MAGRNMEVTDNSEEFQKQFRYACLKALHWVGGLCESEVKQKLTDNQSVITGLLRNSITYALAGKEPQIKTYSSDDGTISGEYEGTAPEEDDEHEESVYIGTNVEYAPYVELGHSQEPGRYVPAIGKRLVAAWVNGKPYLRPGVQIASQSFEDIFEQCFGPLDQTENG